MALVVKNPPANGGDSFQALGWEDPLEEGLAAHSSILVWRIPWTEEPGQLQSMGPQRVGHNLATEHKEKEYFPSFEIFSILETRRILATTGPRVRIGL